eukprot:m.187123 g.187123  ORF g.187123 m.187123 type:complete len:400 (-) comp15602_c0_seq1:188-1387(-)
MKLLFMCLATYLTSCLAQEEVLKGVAAAMSSVLSSNDPSICIKENGHICHSLDERDPWLQIDIGSECVISEVHIYNRLSPEMPEGDCGYRLLCDDTACRPTACPACSNSTLGVSCGFVVTVGNTPCTHKDEANSCLQNSECFRGDVSTPEVDIRNRLINVQCREKLIGRYITIALPGPLRTINLFRVEARGFCGLAKDVYVINKELSAVTATLTGVDERITGVDEEIIGVEAQINDTNIKVEDNKDDIRNISELVLKERENQADLVLKIFSNLTNLAELIHKEREKQADFASEITANLTKIAGESGKMESKINKVIADIGRFDFVVLEIKDQMHELNENNKDLEDNVIDIVSENNALRQQNKQILEQLSSLQTNFSMLVAMIEEMKKPCVCEEKHGCRP